MAILLLAARAAPAAEDLRVEASATQGSAVAINARANLKAPEAVIWQTLTDYGGLPGFIPGMKRSRVIDRVGRAAIVEQEGEATFLLLTFPIRVVVESAEFPPHSIQIRVLSGNLKQLAGGYRIEPGATAGENVLRWFGVIEPDTVLPSIVTVPLMRASVERQFTGMVREIERRGASRREGEAANAGE